MIRKLNFTDRKKISASRIPVTLNGQDNYPLSFDIALVDLALPEFGFPKDASVFVEAYKRTAYSRFAFGTVGGIIIPRNRKLVRMEPGVIPLFRVKIVDATSGQGRILGLADKISPRGIDIGTQDRIPLLHVEVSENLKDQIWRLDLSSEWPVLELNSQVDSIKEIAKSDTHFLSLVYPNIVRQVLNNIIDEHLDSVNEEEEDWPSHWVKFVSSLPGVSSLPTENSSEVKQEQEDWVEEAVAAFSQKLKLLENYQKLIESGQE